jgi:hypothetical protein
MFKSPIDWGIKALAAETFLSACGPPAAFACP